MTIARFCCLACLALAALLALPALGQSAHVLTLQGAIGPASADYVARSLAKAEAARARLVVLTMDTPGGLDTSMRAIIKAILASPVPVAAFVHPGGARAASAGTYILYASHIAAMAPGTNLGAATPVAIGFGGETAREPQKSAGKDEKDDKQGKGGKDAKPAAEQPAPAGETMSRKQVHDAAAYIRSLAELRGRNAEWAEQAVREAVSLSASEALRIEAIDLIADNVADLLVKANGFQVTLPGGAATLDTEGVTAVAVDPDWRSRLLAVIGDPSIAYILMLLGIYGIIYEFANPGFGVPGVAGAICLLLAMFALQLLPINYAGLGLIILGIAFMVTEAFMPSFGVLGLGGIVAFVIGSVMLIDTDLPGYGISWGLIIPFAAVTALFMFFVVGMAIRARRRPVVTGREEMLGATGEVLADFEQTGWARIHGESWQVRSPAPLARGTAVRVTAIDGLVLTVEPLTTREGD